MKNSRPIVCELFKKNDIGLLSMKNVEILLFLSRDLRNLKNTLAQHERFLIPNRKIGY
jgi:hypothetical protein